MIMVKMNFNIEGNGETVVFIHGLSDNLLYWEPLVAGLKNDYNIIRYDLRGHGKSELGDDDISIDLLTDDLKNLLDELGVEKVNLVGFSLGGAISLNFAVKYPSRVSSLVLMSTAPCINSHSNEVLDKFSTAIDESFEEFYDFILPLILCPDIIEENREELDLIKEVASASANNLAIKKAIDATRKFDIEDKLGEIATPTLVLAGKHDGIFLVSQQKEMQENIQNSKLVVFDNVRHNLLVGKNIEKITEILKEFF